MGTLATQASRYGTYFCSRQAGLSQAKLLELVSSNFKLPSSAATSPAALRISHSGNNICNPTSDFVGRLAREIQLKRLARRPGLGQWGKPCVSARGPGRGVGER
jgi:hypothetical protein